MTRQQLQNWTGYIELPTEHTEPEARAIAESLGLRSCGPNPYWTNPNGIMFIHVFNGVYMPHKVRKVFEGDKCVPLSSIKEDTDKQLRRKAAWLTLRAILIWIAVLVGVCYMITKHQNIFIGAICVLVVGGMVTYLVADTYRIYLKRLKAKKGV